MNTQEIAKSFLSLPSESLPKVYGNNNNDSAPELWSAIRLIAAGKIAVGVVESDTITMAADRPEWKDGISINVETGSVDTRDGWWYENEDGEKVNAADLGEVVEVIKDDNGEWVEV